MKNPFSLAFEDGASERRFMARYADDNQDFYLLGAIAVLALQLAILVRNYIEPVALAGEVQVLVSGITLPATMLALVLLWRRRLPIPWITHGYALFIGSTFLAYPFVISGGFLPVWGYKNLAVFMFAAHALRLRARIMLPANLLLLCLYAALAKLVAGLDNPLLLIHLAILAAGLALGIMVAYLFELNSRRHFEEIRRLVSPANEVEKGRVFVSHSGRDRDVVEASIVEYLQRQGYSAWYSTSDIRSASDWQNSILTALEQSDWFLLVMSGHSATSEWVKDEVFWAIDHRPNRIVPVKLDDCDEEAFHIRLRRIQAIDFRDPAAGQPRILEALLDAPGREPVSAA